MIHSRVQMELKLCNCTLPFAPVEYKSQYCNYTQTRCVERSINRDLVDDYLWNMNPCLSTCTEMHVGFVGHNVKEKSIGYKSVNKSDQTDGITSVTIEINSQPKLLTRSARLTNLDLVITIGSIVGIFFGASLLSLIEFIHLWSLSRF
ncbi:uncharacterized protein LOC129571421 [Sitodiplosis mosellana]|uniref:uncharacterized protein LOC129571421 n=1 Tax=Sitodiplosis mosellana TaxID=263140 RepID=UPI002445010B|nr:uncharacterized protein LOC129571421 [Sitodiplosis mosellana]